MPYEYLPTYGTEPYAANGVAASTDFGGGATITNKNLLITLWNIPGFDPGLNLPPVSGQLIKPIADTAAFQTASNAAAAAGVRDLKNALNTVFDSRYSARVLLASDQGVPSLSEWILAILQPPQDLKNNMLTIAKGSSFSSTTPNFAFVRSILESNAWDFKAANIYHKLFSESAYFGGLDGSFYFTKTSGANGVFPSFYTDEADLFESLVEGAPFYVPCVFSRTETLINSEQADFTFSWPGSNARR